MTLFAEILVYLFVFILLWIFILYPVFLNLVSSVFNKPLDRVFTYQPDITVILSLYNEEHYVEDCVNSVFNSDYPVDKIKLLAGSDGSNDKTIEKLHQLKQKFPNIDIYEFPRKGKNNVLNQLIPKAETELVFFLDADLRLRKDCISRLVANLADENVGSTLAVLNIIGEDSESNAGNKGEQSYQSWESRIRHYESRVYTTVNNFGTIACKKSLLKPIPDSLVCDDFFLLLCTVDAGKRAYYENTAIVDEVRKKSLSGELQRRVRLVGGGISTLMKFKKLLFFQRGIASFFIWNHKVLRWLTPLIMIYFLLAPVFLNESYLQMPILYFNIALYSSALIAWVSEKAGIKFNIFKLPLFFVIMNIGFLLGIFRFLSKGNNAVWERIDTK